MKSEWLPCTFQTACRMYKSGAMLRAEVEEGVYKLFSKTICELAEPFDVLDYKLEWEYRND